MRVLIIDDDEEDVEYFLETLKKVNAQCGCMVASNCEKGLVHLAAESEPPTHIFLDGMLYGISSKEFLVELKKNEKLKAAKIIMYSGFARTDIQQEFLTLGADHFLVKPSAVNELEEALIRILGCDKN
jgi:DNA-binding response OmpR family regulator